MRIVNFADLLANFELEPGEAVAFFRAKGLASSWSYLDMLGQDHDLAFTVAKMLDTDLLATVRARLDAAIAQGKTLAEFKLDLIPTLQAAGWWGKKDMIDPLTGRIVEAQLGSASRLETIFRTNLQSAYAVGHWQSIEANKSAAPYLMYDAVDDHRTRPEHAALDGTVLPTDHPFWRTHTPPNGWNCRCSVIQLSAADLADYGLTVSAAPAIRYKTWTNPRTGISARVPVDVDPGFDHNPGLARAEQIKAAAAQKAASLTKAEQRALSAAEKPVERMREATKAALLESAAAAVDRPRRKPQATKTTEAAIVGKASAIAAQRAAQAAKEQAEMLTQEFTTLTPDEQRTALARLEEALKGETGKTAELLKGMIAVLSALLDQ